MAPQLAVLRDGRTALSWLEPSAEGHRFLLSMRAPAGGWSPAVEVSSGGAFFANWADLPGIVEAQDGSLYAHWLSALGDETYAYGVQLARSGDGGESWSHDGWLHDDTSLQEHGFVSYVSLPEGVQAFWLDGRAMGDGEGAMGLRTVTLGSGPEAPPSTLLDDRVCECCATDAALTGSGPVVVYRDRSDEEIRDISLVRRTAGGWSDPIAVHRDSWEIHGCPVNGPAVAAADDRVAVAWFTAADDRAQVLLAFSKDRGESFEPPIVIDDYKPVGRVDLAMAEDGRVWVLWSGQGGVIRIRELAPDGSTVSTRMVAQSTSSRSAGVPRLARRGSELLVAWRSPSGVQVTSVE